MPNKLKLKKNVISKFVRKEPGYIPSIKNLYLKKNITLNFQWGFQYRYLFSTHSLKMPAVVVWCQRGPRHQQSRGGSLWGSRLSLRRVTVQPRKDGECDTKNSVMEGFSTLFNYLILKSIFYVSYPKIIPLVNMWLLSKQYIEYICIMSKKSFGFRMLNLL